MISTSKDRRCIEINRVHWNSVTPLHLKSDFYPVNEVVKGASSLSPTERRELGSLEGLSGAHLQCGIGLDTISLSRLGAQMSGFDISKTALDSARALAATTRQQIHFVESDVCSIPTAYDSCFDFVYTSHGVLRWLPNLDSWALGIQRMLKPGGFFYIYEIHPLVYRLKSIRKNIANLEGNYFEKNARLKRLNRTHASKGNLGQVAHNDWTLASVFQAILNAGLSIVEYAEHKGCSYSRKGLLKKRVGQLWYPESKVFPIPLSFSIRATNQIR